MQAGLEPIILVRSCALLLELPIFGGTYSLKTEHDIRPLPLLVWIQVPALTVLAVCCGASIVPVIGCTVGCGVVAALVARRLKRHWAAWAIAAALMIVPLPWLLPAGQPVAEFLVLDAIAFLATGGWTLRTSFVARQTPTDATREYTDSQPVNVAREHVPGTHPADEITGLPTRILLMHHLNAALAAIEPGLAQVLVFYLDLANFKSVNETTGHASGDRALEIIATRIRRCIRGADIASRVGGDEFTIVCMCSNALTESGPIAERLLAALSEPITAGNTRMRLGTNIGLSIAPDDGIRAEELISKAETAMYRAKELGVNRYQIYAPEMHMELLEKSTLRRDLESAIAQDEFVVYFQPIINLMSQVVIGAEALVRWNHPTRGLLAPIEFVSFAEQNGLITRIGEIVIRKASEQINRFVRCTNPDFTMAVNVSAVQFRQPDFVQSIAAILASFGLEHRRLEIEITESAIMDDVVAVVRSLRELEQLGVRLSIDDFGTGYSSLAYVKNFPVHTLKIDRSFIRDVAESPTDQAIAATIITLAHNLGMRVVAEGIETAEQFERLRIMGADDMQGYLLSRPLPPDEFERFALAAPAILVA